MTEVNDCTIELINELGNNVKSISYDTESKKWTVSFIRNLTPVESSEDDILDFLRNG